MYGFPALLLVTWRGFGGHDAPEHILTGEITPSLLDLLRIPHKTLDAAASGRRRTRGGAPDCRAAAPPPRDRRGGARRA
jgi:hypothetical protein